MPRPRPGGLSGQNSVVYLNQSPRIPRRDLDDLPIEYDCG